MSFRSILAALPGAKHLQVQGGGKIKFEFVLYLQNAREVVVLHVEFDCRTVFDSDL